MAKKGFDFAKELKKLNSNNAKKGVDNSPEAETSNDAASQVRPKFESKPTHLMFYKKYVTYQGIFSIWPGESMEVKDCLSKVILYVIQWLKNRIGEEQLETIGEVAFIRDDYKKPEEFREFDISKMKNISIDSVLEMKSLYNAESETWSFILAEPDNNNEGKGLIGRVFKTDIFVSKEEEKVVLGVRITCQEPTENDGDASVYRPAFVRSIFKDKELVIGEYGLPRQYAFSENALAVNGKANSECEDFYNLVIANVKRQIPVVFCSEEYYRDNKKTVDGKAASFLGYAHVVVILNNQAKLFIKLMENEEYLESIEDGQIILHLDNEVWGKGFAPQYYDTEEEDVIDKLDKYVKKCTLRKGYSFGEFAFYDEAKRAYDRAAYGASASQDAMVELEELRQDKSKLILDLNEQKRDATLLQNKVEKLNKENQSLQDSVSVLGRENLKLENDLHACKEKITGLNERIAKLNEKVAENTTLNSVLSNVSINNIKRRYLPLLNFPSFKKEARDEIIDWIEKYYSDLIIVHPKAVKSLQSEPRNVDWRTLCLMIHYLYGYTEHMNNGGIRTIDAARDYDVEDNAFAVEPSSSGSGSLKELKDKYTIDITEYAGEKKQVLLDMHIISGKGMDANMIRLYFNYDSELKKSIIGYMPGHLPTRKDKH